MLALFAALASAGCGVMGLPIPPEDVGVTPLIDRQKRLDAQNAKAQESQEAPPVLEPQGQDTDLPPLRPVGTR